MTRLMNRATPASRGANAGVSEQRSAWTATTGGVGSRGNRQDPYSLFMMPMTLFPGYQDQGVGIDHRCNRTVGGRIFSATEKKARPDKNAADRFALRSVVTSSPIL